MSVKGSLVCFCCVFFVVVFGGGSSDLIYRNKLFAFMWLPQSVATMKYESLPTIYCVRDNQPFIVCVTISWAVMPGNYHVKFPGEHCLCQEVLVNALKNL